MLQAVALPSPVLLLVASPATARVGNMIFLSQGTVEDLRLNTQKMDNSIS